jgi:poly(beta-D-mannuronate) lyase
VHSASLTNPGVQGFTAGAISMQKWDSKGFPVYGASGANNATKKILDSLNAIASTRGVRAFSNKVGANNLIYFSALFANAPKLGNNWESKKLSATSNTTSSATPSTAKTIAVSTASELATAAANGTATTVVLKAGTYTFSQPIVIKGSTTITSNGALVNIATSSSIDQLFTLEQNAQLTLRDININASGATAQNFIAANSDGSAIHGSVFVRSARIENYVGGAIIKAPKTAYLDQIVVENSWFSLNKAVLLSLKDEDDNKGYYNAERIVVNNNSFMNHVGPLALIYRGGNDESTMGPIFSFSANKIVNCAANEPLLGLFGVQQSTIENNMFTASNATGNIIVYTDNTKAFHYQKNNSVNQSGAIQENKFVINK